MVLYDPSLAALGPSCYTCVRSFLLGWDHLLFEDGETTKKSAETAYGSNPKQLLLPKQSQGPRLCGERGREADAYDGLCRLKIDLVNHVPRLVVHKQHGKIHSAQRKPGGRCKSSMACSCQMRRPLLNHLQNMMKGMPETPAYSILRPPSDKGVQWSAISHTTNQ